METTLQGTDGEETVTVDNLGKVLKIDDSTRVEPVAGNDVYLTVDSKWQSAIYQILKQRVAGILLSNCKKFPRAFYYFLSLQVLLLSSESSENVFVIYSS